MSLTLAELNNCDAEAFASALDGVYESTRWVGERTALKRPFASWAALKHALARTVREATHAEQMALIQAHPELSGKAASTSLSEDSRAEQAQAGLMHCTHDEVARLQMLNAAYRARFRHPFILAVRGPTGAGLSPAEIIATLERRLKQQPAEEFSEALRQIDRIAELRLNERGRIAQPMGQQVMQWAESLAQHTDRPGQLTVAYLTPAHQAVSEQLMQWMREAGFDQVERDAVGNVVGRYLADAPEAKTLMTGSHFDTVRDGGKYDGRLGVLLPIAVVRHLHTQGKRYGFNLEVIGFADEEGARFRTSFLGSSALIGRFEGASLNTDDAQGIRLREAMQEAGLDLTAIADAARDRRRLLGFVEIHIEQGPVLLERDLPVGVVTSIAGSVRMQVQLSGTASHAGTTPMGMRRDAAAAAAEIVLLVERRCAEAPGLVGTVGTLQVPDGSTNVVPGACHFSLDIRAADDDVLDAAVRDVLDGMQSICARRRIEHRVEETMRVGAVPCDPDLAERWRAAIAQSGLPVFDLPSGAGHDAMKLAEITPVAMLFTRCGNGGISHNPLETMTADDAELAGRLLLRFLDRSDER